MKKLFFLLMLCPIGSAYASDIFSVCTRNHELRWLRTFQSSDGKCKTVYSKEGFAQVVSSSTAYSSCEAVLLNVKKNVEDGGFKCKDQKLNGYVEM